MLCSELPTKTKVEIVAEEIYRHFAWEEYYESIKSKSIKRIIMLAKTSFPCTPLSSAACRSVNQSNPISFSASLQQGRR